MAAKGIAKARRTRRKRAVGGRGCVVLNFRTPARDARALPDVLSYRLGDRSPDFVPLHFAWHPGGGFGMKQWAGEKL
jgi:hypothetical protein